MTADGWTEADQAELDTILWVFVGAYRAHEFCGDCQRIRRRVGYGMCQTLATAWDAAESWLRVRRLLSRAQHLRACQRILEDSRKTYATESLTGDSPGRTVIHGQRINDGL